MGITLDDLKKKAQKQIKKKNYMGWFQNFNAGNVPLNNAIFNSFMGTASDATDSVSGIGEADGGIGMVGAMGEDLEKEGNRMPEKVKFYYTSTDSDLDKKWYEEETDELVVDKEDVIQALLNLLRYDESFVYMDDDEFESIVRNHWVELKDKYYEELFEIFSHNLEDMDEYSDNFTDEFYNDDVECECEKEEEDPYFTQTLFEGLKEYDPTFTPKYESIHKSLNESYENKFYDIDKILDKAFDYGYSYGYEGDEAFQRLLKKIPTLSEEDLERVENAFYNGNHEAEMKEEENYYSECVHTKNLPDYDDLNESNISYDDTVDNFYGYDDELTKEYDEKYPYRYYDEEENEEDLDYNDEPLEESAMSELDLEIQDPEFINKLRRNIKYLENEIDFLVNQAPKEIRRGGAFDSQEEIDDALEATQRELNREKAKLAIIQRSQK